jgi:hypothetical protein
VKSATKGGYVFLYAFKSGCPPWLGVGHTSQSQQQAAVEARAAGDPLSAATVAYKKAGLERAFGRLFPFFLTEIWPLAWSHGV